MAKAYKAIFLDRDGTISRRSAEKEAERDRAVGEILGIPDFKVLFDMNSAPYWRRVMDGLGFDKVDTLDREASFWRKCYRITLEDNGFDGDSESMATELHERFAFHRMMEPYPETVGVLETLRAQGYRMGVISDTFPSLEESLKHMGLAHYFDSFTASAVVGVGKPDPRIFNAALESLGVLAEESVFVDDYKFEADGARDQGFTSFHLDRDLAEPNLGSWTIGNLGHLIEYLGIPRGSKTSRFRVIRWYQSRKEKRNG